ncbi:hypothetical protein DL96DRAFT_1606406 [Flagelloscypha sp. PMI_526]|nr:hypothetical protein DL96DRAFT_1606406 [Flagelloscypha sp. PMI_526]
MFYHDDNAKRAPEDLVKHISTPHDLQLKEVRVGDVVHALGNRFTWSNDCVPAEVCADWRSRGDPLCDEALREMFSSGIAGPAGKDLYDFLETYVAAKKHDANSPSVKFWNHIHDLPPAGAQVTDDETLVAQRFYLDCSLQITQGLLYYTLAGGFASPRIVRTLRSISYLVTPSKAETKEADDRTYTRLLETMQFFTDVLGCTTSPTTKPSAYLLPGGEGWKSCIRVRMLHGVARNRVLTKWKRDGLTESIVPIAQEDMSGTLAGFSTTPLWVLNSLGIPSTSIEQNAYLSLWRHIGFYMGVEPDIILRYFTSVRTSTDFLASLMIALLGDDEGNYVAAEGPTLPILRATSNRAPTYAPVQYAYAYTRKVLGPELSEHLAVPKPGFWMGYIRFPAVLWAQHYPVVFGRYYSYIRPGWRDARRAVLREMISRGVRNGMGLRKTHFRPRDEKGGDLEKDAQAAEKLIPDYIGGKRMMWNWVLVLTEMILVSTFGAVGMAAALFMFMKMLHKNFVLYNMTADNFML